MTQSRRQSAIEAVVGVCIGLFTAYGASFVIFPVFGIETSYFQNGLVVVSFSIVSIFRTYITRRLFSYLNSKNII